MHDQINVILALLMGRVYLDEQVQGAHQTRVGFSYAFLHLLWRKLGVGSKGAAQQGLGWTVREEYFEQEEPQACVVRKHQGCTFITGQARAGEEGYINRPSAHYLLRTR